MRVHTFSTLQDDLIRQRPAKYIKNIKKKHTHTHTSEKSRGFLLSLQLDTRHVISTRSSNITHVLHFVTYSRVSVTFREILQSV